MISTIPPIVTIEHLMAAKDSLRKAIPSATYVGITTEMDQFSPNGAIEWTFRVYVQRRGMSSIDGTGPTLLQAVTKCMTADIRHAG